MKVYPNPFEGQTTIDISNLNRIENTILEVFDLTGQEVLNTPFGKSGKLILNRGHLKPGIYFYKVFQSGMQVSTGKIIVQ